MVWSEIFYAKIFIIQIAGNLIWFISFPEGLRPSAMIWSGVLWNVYVLSFVWASSTGLSSDSSSNSHDTHLKRDQLRFFGKLIWSTGETYHHLEHGHVSKAQPKALNLNSQRNRKCFSISCSTVAINHYHWVSICTRAYHTQSFIWWGSLYYIVLVW